jgi:hypothetical protein
MRTPRNDKRAEHDIGSVVACEDNGLGPLGIATLSPARRNTASYDGDHR